MICEEQSEYARDETLDPSSWLPFAMGVDSSDMAVVDTSAHPLHSGSVWCLEKHGYFRAFDSLGDAIAAATYCVQAGIWSIEDDGFSIVCSERDSAPGPTDLHETPSPPTA